MKKRYLAAAAAAILLTAGISGQAKSPDKVKELFAKAVGDIAGTDSGTLMDTSEYTLPVLEKLDAWYVNIGKDYVSLETQEETFVFDNCRSDGMMLLAKGMAAKYAYDEFVDEEIMLLVGREDIGNFIVTDDNFSQYLVEMEDLGYKIDGPDADEFISELEERLEEDSRSDSGKSWDRIWNDVRSGKRDSSGSSDGFRNDLFVEAPKPGEIVPDGEAAYEADDDDYCEVCYNTGNCQTCLGRGYWFNNYDLTQAIECSCHNGKCPACGG